MQLSRLVRSDPRRQRRKSSCSHLICGSRAIHCQARVAGEEGASATVGLPLGFFRTLGPAVAISIVVAGLTLTPALIAITKGAFFWPRWPKTQASTDDVASHVWRRVGTLVAKRPALVLIVALTLLTPPVVALSRLEVSLDTLGELPGGAPSLAGYHLIQAHFPVQNQAASIFITTDGSLLQREAAPISRIQEALQLVPGVVSVSDPTFASDGSTARLQLALRDEPSSEQASGTLTAAKPAASRSLDISPLDHTHVLAGGEVAIDRDLRELLGQDFLRVMLLVGLAIYLVRAVLLRHLFAPSYL